MRKKTSRSGNRGEAGRDASDPGSRSDTPGGSPGSAERHVAGATASTAVLVSLLWALVICLLLCVAVAIIYGQTWNFYFTNYDDDQYITGNRHIRNGITLDGIRWSFCSGVGDRYPLNAFTHMLACEFFGADASKPAGGHHLINVVLHAAAAVLLFLALWRLTGDLWPSGFVAAVFAVHPLQVESVAWIAERKDVLSGVFLR